VPCFFGIIVAKFLVGADDALFANRCDASYLLKYLAPLNFFFKKGPSASHCFIRTGTRHSLPSPQLDLVLFLKNRTETKKNRSKTEKTEPKLKKPSQNRQNRLEPAFILKNRTEPKPIGLNRFRFLKKI